MSESSDYQRLRAHLGFLRMTAAAEALPAELDHARAAGLTHQGFLERLLAIEVDAVDERRHSSLARFASLPRRSPWPTSTSPPSPRWTPSSSPSWGRCASWRTPPTSC